MSALLAVTALLACWRVARLFTVDQITRPLRERIIARTGESGQIAYLVTCPWCLSVWTSPPLVFVAVWWPDNRAVWFVLLSLAASGVAGMLQTIEDRLDR